MQRLTFSKGADSGNVRLIVQVVLAIALPTLVIAGPPFITDDPVPLPLHTGEFYLFVTGTHSEDGTALDAAPGIEANFSLFRNTFFHLVVPLVLSKPSTQPSAYGPGDVELGFKWRPVRQSARRPDIGIFPIFVLPTGDENQGLGSARIQVFLPIWLQKDSGPWTMYGGGGYWINPGKGNQNWWFSGIMLQRQLSDRLYLGAEFFRQTADELGAAAGTGFNLGGGFRLAEPYQILFSTGRNIQNGAANQFSFYTACYRTF